jgi:5-formyltetrahydrofolate cyclo-ligase
LTTSRDQLSCTQRKRALRARILARRDSLTAAEHAALSAAVTDRFTALPEVLAARALLCFVSFGSEVDTSLLMTWAIAAGKIVAAPRVIGPRAMEARRVTDPEHDLEQGRFGIMAPHADLPLVQPQELDVVVMPGSAFSAQGERMGYGGGFYDTYVRHATGATRIAPTFELQMVAALPCEPHDLPVDVIVTEERVLRLLRSTPH